GTHLAMTGATCTGADAIALGLADALVPVSMWDDVCARLAAGAPLSEVAAACADPNAPSATPAAGSAGPAPVARAPLLEATWIGECYEGEDPVAIRGWLRSHPHPEARQAADL